MAWFFAFFLCALASLRALFFPSCPLCYSFVSFVVKWFFRLPQFLFKRKVRKEGAEFAEDFPIVTYCA
jgi:hypothetical protein